MLSIEMCLSILEEELSSCSWKKLYHLWNSRGEWGMVDLNKFRVFSRNSGSVRIKLKNISWSTKYSWTQFFGLPFLRLRFCPLEDENENDPFSRIFEQDSEVLGLASRVRKGNAWILHEFGRLAGQADVGIGPIKDAAAVLTRLGKT